VVRSAGAEPLVGPAPRDPAALARAYFESWGSADFARLRALLAERVTFVGPLGTADGPDECVDGLRRLRRTVNRIEVRAVTTVWDDVITWVELETLEASRPIQVANWMRVEEGGIAAIRATFDPGALQ